MRSHRSLLVVALATRFMVLTVAVLGGVAAAPSCTRHDGTPVDMPIMAFLSEARALHHQANIKEEAGDLPGAIGAMERLVASGLPRPERKAAEVEEVLADAYARLAELRLRKGDLGLAALAANGGLQHVTGPTYFRGHLVEVQGLIEEARAAQLADAGAAAEATRARERAIQLLEEVVKIQEQVVKSSLGKGGGP